jgi:hypothetical protein
MSLAGCRPAKLKEINRKTRSIAALNATSKRESVAKLMKAWESKNAKRALQGAGLSTMAVSLAACGGSGSDTPTTPADQTAVKGSGIISLQQLSAVTTGGKLELPEGLALDSAADGELAEFVEALAAANQGVEARYLDVTGSNAADTFRGDSYAVHGIEITAGGGTDTLVINMKGPWAQPVDLNSVEIVNVVNNENEYLNTKMAGWDWTAIDTIGVVANSVLDLFAAYDLEKLIVSEGSFNTNGTLEVRNILSTADIELQGSFSNNVSLTFMGGAGSLDLTLSDVFIDGGNAINIAHNSSIVNLVSNSTNAAGVNDLDGVVFGAELRTLNISGNADLDINNAATLVFDDGRPATINIGAMVIPPESRGLHK